MEYTPTNPTDGMTRRQAKMWAKRLHKSLPYSPIGVEFYCNKWMVKLGMDMLWTPDAVRKAIQRAAKLDAATSWEEFEANL